MNHYARMGWTPRPHSDSRSKRPRESRAQTPQNPHGLDSPQPSVLACDIGTPEELGCCTFKGLFGVAEVHGALYPHSSEFRVQKVLARLHQQESRDQKSHGFLDRTDPQGQRRTVSSLGRNLDSGDTRQRVSHKLRLAIF